jgi:hypothetical protein
MSDTRKATDVLLEMEAKMNTLIAENANMKFNISLISNKLTEIITALGKQQEIAPKFTVEAVNKSPFRPNIALTPPDPERNIPIFADPVNVIPTAPDGTPRRTSRVETKPAPILSKNSLGADGEVIFTDHPEATFPASAFNKTQPPNETPAQTSQIKKIPVIQRCIDKNQKAIFLADVEVIDMNNGQSVYTTRTNGAGKWQASLPEGQYKIRIKKPVRGDEDKIESQQNVKIEGSGKALNLPDIMVKGR